MVIIIKCHKVKVIIVLSSNTVNEGDLFKSRPIRLTNDNLNETVFFEVHSHSGCLFKIKINSVI